MRTATGQKGQEPQNESKFPHFVYHGFSSSCCLTQRNKYEKKEISKAGMFMRIRLFHIPYNRKYANALKDHIHSFAKRRKVLIDESSFYLSTTDSFSFANFQ
jgi:hypothetical protein